jgi:hypothetical protein
VRARIARVSSPYLSVERHCGAHAAITDRLDALQAAAGGER